MTTRNHQAVAFLFALLAGTVPIRGAEAVGPQKSIEELYRLARQATAEILVDGHLSGSGSFVDDNGLLVTAAHVLARPTRKVEVISSVIGRRPAAPVAVDLGHDLVLLQVRLSAGRDSPALPLADALPAVGSEVHLYATPAYRHQIIQRGTIARSELTFEFHSHFVEVLQIAALVQEGTSGGAWLNRRGQIVGIQLGSVASKSGPAGIANVSPATAIGALLRSKRNASTPTVGVFFDEVWILQPDALRRFVPGTEGLFVQQLRNDGPAARAGIQKGEVIVAADDIKIRFRDELLRMIRGKTPGQSVKLTVVRPNGAGSRSVPVRLGELEVAWPQADIFQ
jgi:S1-C subfamily serine protease